MPLIFLIFSCQKEDIEKQPINSKKQESSQKIVFNVSDQTIGTRTANATDETQTMLGALRQNPFTVEKMAEAHNNLYGTTLTELETTHLYVKFIPDDIEDIYSLIETEEFFYDFPIEYEVIEMGDFYQELGEDELPDLYAILEVNFQFPDVAHEIIDELHLNNPDPILVAESFSITGNQEEIQDYIFTDDGIQWEELGGNAQGIVPPVPDEPCDPGCFYILVIDPDGPIDLGEGDGPRYRWECFCPPPPPPPVPEFNDCGCVLSTNIRMPGGCVSVEDTQLSTPGDPLTFEGVRRVKVIIKDTWFKEDETWTDDNGCWQIEKEYRGSAWMWIKFINNRCRMRAGASIPNNVGLRWIYAWVVTVKDYVGVISGPNFNNIQVSYNMWAQQGSQAHRYWGASTVNNCVHEFTDYAVADNINTPPPLLDISLTPSDRDGYAIMSTQFTISVAVGTILTGLASPLGPAAPIIGAIGFAATWVVLPDVNIGINFQNSDQLKLLAYHEIAHASHFTQVGGNYWEQLVLQTAFAGGHGTANTTTATGLIEICESWAEYLAHDYANRTYRVSSFPLNPTYEEIIERTWNETQDHIPIGLHHDLVDVGEPVLFPGTPITLTACNQEGGGCGTINDNVFGFTHEQMFGCLNSSIMTIAQYQGCLETNQLNNTGNTVAQLNDLFNSY